MHQDTRTICLVPWNYEPRPLTAVKRPLGSSPEAPPTKALSLSPCQLRDSRSIALPSVLSAPPRPRQYRWPRPSGTEAPPPQPSSRSLGELSVPASRRYELRPEFTHSPHAAPPNRTKAPPLPTARDLVPKRRESSGDINSVHRRCKLRPPGVYAFLSRASAGPASRHKPRPITGDPNRRGGAPDLSHKGKSSAHVRLIHFPFTLR